MSVLKTEQVSFFDFNDLKSVLPKAYYDNLWQAYRIYDNSVCDKTTLINIMTEVMCDHHDAENIKLVIEELKSLSFTAVHNGIF